MKVDIETLADFFGVEEDAETLRANATALAKASKEALKHALPPGLRDAAAMSVVESARGLLNSPLSGILGDAWKTVRDLERFCDPKHFPPDKIAEYTLHEHELALKRTPVIEVMLNGAPTGMKLKFELKLSLSLMSAVLKIQDARIVGARIGDCKGGGKYSCTSVTLAERKTGKLRLPGSISFGEGIPIPRAR